MAHLWNARAGRLSVQVLSEFYVTATRKLKPGLEPTAARGDIRSLCAWRPLPMDLKVLDGAWCVLDRYGLSFGDSLIVSAALVAGCRHLLTEDLQEGQELDALRFVNPFLHDPQDLE